MLPRMARILLVDDELAIAQAVQYALRAEGFACTHAATAGDALRLAADGAFDLALLDVGLPDRDGFALCRDLRRDRDVPVIFLTARGEEAERVRGFELGADDYVAKPFSPRELVARVRAVLRRAQAPATTTRDSGDFRHDADARRLWYRGHALDLTRYEYGLLAALLQRPGAVLTRDQLMARVWGDDSDTSDRTVDTHVKTLRAKLRAVAPDTDPIRTARGVGYALQADG